MYIPPELVALLAVSLLRFAFDDHCACGLPSTGLVQSLAVCSPVSTVRTRTWYVEPLTRLVNVWLVPVVTSVSVFGQFAADFSLICAS